MRYSQMLLPTTKETPAEAEVVSHQLLLRAGFIRKLTSGLYSYLPLGLRVLRKVEQIVREEMNRAGAQELLMPMVQPADLWQRSGRWQKYGPELLRFVDRHQRDYCLGPTHEEVVTELADRDLHSYRDLPINLYQVQTKFRDEIRPRFGLMRGREFVMKDGYSFDVDDAAAGVTYNKMYAAYKHIFRRCGLAYRPVEADTGSIGGSFSHEFMVLAATGEDTLVVCQDCDFAANVEKAAVKMTIDPAISLAAKTTLPALVEVETPNRKKVARVAEFLGCAVTEVIKTMIYRADGELVAVLVRGDREIQPVKLKNLLQVDEVELADDLAVYEETGLPVGYLGPVELPLKVVADQEVMALTQAVTGANKKGFHCQGVVPGRDFTPALTGDLRLISGDDRCPSCEGTLALTEGIEVGHIFKLGTAYSEAMNATFQDQVGEEKPFVMGCYGIGVSRVVAAAIEQNHDKDGMIFPVALAPFQLILLNLGLKDEALCAVADELYQTLEQANIEVLYDDRDQRPGAKFKDADLLGIPFRLTVGKTYTKEGKIELRRRRDGWTASYLLEELPTVIQDLLDEEFVKASGA